MRHPYERWLKFQLQFSDFSREEIIELSANYGFVEPKVEELLLLKRQLRATKPKARKGSRKYLKWIRDEQLWGMYSRHPDVAAAQRHILQKSHTRQVVEYLLVANTPCSEISVWVEQQLGTPLKASVIQAYTHYYWDVDTLSPSQWFEYFKAIPSGFKMQDCYQIRSPEYALWKLGHRVKLNRTEAFESMRHEGFMRFTDTSRLSNNMHTSQTAKNWADIAMSADDRLAGQSDAMASVLEELQGLRIALGRREISSVTILREEKLEHTDAAKPPPS